MSDSYKHIKSKRQKRHKKMKTLEECAGLPKSSKLSTQDSEAKYWATAHNKERKFKRPDGSIGIDKTAGWHSRPGHKLSVKNAIRRQKKKARQNLKRQMMSEIKTDN